MADLKTGLQYRTIPEQSGPRRVLPDGQIKPMKKANANGPQRTEEQLVSLPKQAAKRKAIRWMLGAMGITGGGLGIGLSDWIF